MGASGKRIAIVGAGTAGSAVATLLARAGHAVTVFETVPEPGPVGAGITLQPTGQHALARLGLREAVVARGARIDRLTVVRPGARPLFDLPYADYDPAMFGVGIHRGVLFEQLFAAARASGADVRCGIEILDTDVDGKGRWVKCKDARHGPYDLVVAADGSVCELHGAAPRVKSSPYPWGAAWVVADDPGFAADRRIYQIVDGAHTMLGFLPTGMAPGRDTPVISLFWSMRGDRVDAWRAAGLPAWRDRVLELEPRAEPILDSVRDIATVRYTRYRDVAMWPWHGDRIVFIGDAAHATSPQLGQGANLALVDAVTLADAVAAEPDVGAALARYTRERKRQLAFYQFATRALTPLFQSDGKVMPWLRDRIFPMARWLRPLRRRMVRTMCGIDRGIVRRPMQLPPG